MRAADQRGFSIVEAVLAAFLLATGALSVLQLADAGTRNTFRATQSQVVVNRLQAEMEAIKQLPFDSIALTAAPATSSDPDSPASRSSGTHFAIDREGTEMRPLVVNQSEGDLGAVEPLSDFTSGDVAGQVHRYVVWVNDDACSEALCPGSEDLKRVIVAVTLDDSGSGGTRAYQELQSEVVDPDVTPVEDPVPPGEQPETHPATFWLTDTSCKESERQPITGSHPSHNTLGICSDGTVTGDGGLLGEGGGSPDLMGIEQPVLCEDGDLSCNPDEIPPLYDYSDEVPPGEEGLQLLRPDSSLESGCVLNGTLTTNLLDHREQHLWLSRPIEDYGLEELALVNQATLSLWTKAPVAMQGRVCVHLFKRAISFDLLGLPVVTDTPVVNAELTGINYFTHPTMGTTMQWPTEWTELTVPMRFASLTLLPNERLGIALGVERSGTGSEGPLEFAYDHPSFESRLQVQSQAVLPPLFGD